MTTERPLSERVMEIAERKTRQAMRLCALADKAPNLVECMFAHHASEEAYADAATLHEAARVLDERQ